MCFVFTGFLKGVDPLGSMYKIEDYLTVLHLSSLLPFSLPLAILLNGAEFLIGVALIMNLRIRTSSWMALIFMVFFTILTLVSAIFNLVSDCGCFGEAIKISNWQTFFKNIILIILALIVFAERKQFKSTIKALSQWLIVFLIAVIFIVFSVYSYKHLPVINFLPYKIGVNIPENMVVPQGKPKDIYETRLYYKKNGEVKEFTMTDYPWKDTMWKWVDTKSVLIKEGYKPPIHDFVISNTDGEDVTEEILSDTGYVMLVVSYNLSEANPGALKKIVYYANYFNSTRKVKIYLTTATSASVIAKMNLDTLNSMRILNMDQTVLKTIIRSNPGLVLLKQGAIISTWHYNDIPDFTKMNSDFLFSQLQQSKSDMEVHTILNLFLIFGIILFIAYKMAVRTSK